MKRLLLFAISLFLAPHLFAVNQAANGFCATGGVKVNTQGALSTTTVQASYPRCSVKVFFTGTTTVAPIFDSAGNSLGNPLTAKVDGSWIFYAATGVGYDIVMSGGTPLAFPTAFTLTGIFTGASGSGGATFPSTPGVVFNTSPTVSRNAIASDVASLFPGTTPCFLKSDGTCASAGTVNSGTAGQIAQYPASGTTVGGATVSGDATVAVGGALTLAAVNGAPGTCGDATHVSQPTINGKGLTTGCAAIPIVATPGGTAGGDLSGTYPNPAVSKVNSAAVPTSLPVVATNGSGQLVAATKQGSGTSVQMAAGATHVVNDLAIYDSGGNVIDSNVLISSVPLLSGTNTWTAKNTFSSEADVASGTSGFFTTPTLMLGQLSGATFFALTPTTGVARFGSPTGSNFLVTPTGNVGGMNSSGIQTWGVSNVTSIANFGLASGLMSVVAPNGMNGQNASAVQQWSISNVNGSAQFGPSAGGFFSISTTGGIAGFNASVAAWQISTVDGSASFKSLGGMTKITNSAGLQVVSAPICAIAAGTGSLCSVSMSPLPVTEPDALYKVVGCQADNVQGAGIPVPAQTGAETTTSFAINVYNMSPTNAVLAGGTLTCLVIHN